MAGGGTIGFTTKVHLSADGRCRPLSLVVPPGQRADCTQFDPVLEKIRVPRVGPGRPRKKADSLAADKAYSNGPCRAYLRERAPGTRSRRRPTAGPPRLRKGSRGGRHRASTRSGTRNATPSNGPSTS
ncbi:transposase [Streptomyces sp. ID38640]|uniref:transposase n=1 Tax=Streptomyces sp. ID38640 TaxID=1265399 RepID=UPI00140F3CD6|nr:transposase [Streptomyces sp. ID38640]